MAEPLLVVDDLHVTFQTHGNRAVHAVDGVSLTVNAGETVGIVGESGSGKSVTALAILGLLPSRGVTTSGSVRLNGQELLGAPERVLQDVRGRRAAMVFQDPMTSLNPVLTIGRQLIETITRHLDLDRHEASSRAIELLDRVGIPEARRRLKSYPHQLSGGERQRAAVARALVTSPRLVLADEPTGNLDGRNAEQVFALMLELNRELGTSLVVVTHDTRLAARMDRVLELDNGALR